MTIIHNTIAAISYADIAAPLGSSAPCPPPETTP